MKQIEKFLEKYGFKPCLYYKAVNNEIYHNYAKSTIKEDKFKKAFRSVGNHKIYVAHYKKSEPHITYYITVGNIVYSADYHKSVINEMVAELKEIVKKEEKVITICYGKQEEWEHRQDAINEFWCAINGSDGSEQQRYLNVYRNLMAGYKVCTDQD